MRLRFTPGLSHLVTAALAVAVSASTASAQITFSAPGGCPAGDCGAVGNAGGLTWYYGTLLNVGDYKASLTGLDPVPATGYPVSGGVALGTGYMQVQAADWNPFWLNSLTVGSGWLNGITLTLKGYLDVGGPTVINESKVLFASVPQTTTAASPSAWNFAAAGPIRYFTIDVNWGEDDMPAWDGTGSAPSWVRSCPVGVCTGSYAVDPWNSRALKRDADTFHQQTYDGKPYETYFVQGATTAPYTVPEPGTAGLVAVGLAVLGAAGRRRRAHG